MPAQSCPPRKDLLRFLDEQWEPTSRGVIASHVDDCRQCQDALEELTRGLAYGLSVLDRGVMENGSTQEDPYPCMKAESTAGPDGLAACEGKLKGRGFNLTAPTVDLGPPDSAQTADGPLPPDPQEPCDREPSKPWPTIPSYEI